MYSKGKMRSEHEMLKLILSTAQDDDRIRAVTLNGSRANPNAKPDRFQDFDIIYLVTDLAPFVDDPTWIDLFGERMIVQTPSLIEDPALKTRSVLRISCSSWMATALI